MCLRAPKPKTLTQTLNTQENYLSIGDVRIHPASMSFAAVFEGISYTELISIMNCGKETVFVRILQPSSLAIKMKPLYRGEFLAPGLTITRTVKYKNQASVNPIAVITIPIFVNEVQIGYQIHIERSHAKLGIEPRKLDFDVIDVGRVANVQNVVLRNKGTSVLVFAVDVPKGDLNIIIEPAKGIIDINGKITLNVSAMALKEGEYEDEFWIKCCDPGNVVVKCRVIEPRLTALNALQTSTFVIVEFPNTYYGCYSERKVVIENSSASNSILCILGEIGSVTEERGSDNYILSEARQKSSVFHHFSASPLECSVRPLEAKVFCFRFKPLYRDTPEGPQFCLMKIVRLDCQCITKSFIDSLVQEVTPEEPPNSPTASMTFQTETHGSYHDGFNEDMEVVMVPAQVTPDNIFVRLCLFGIMEHAKVKLVPNSLFVYKMLMMKPEVRYIEVTNLSKNLPIIIKYVKVPYIDLVPNKKQLKPLETIEIEVTITATKIGLEKTKIAFDLLSKERGLDEYFRVGYSEIPVVFDCLAVTKHPKIRCPIEQPTSVIYARPTVEVKEELHKIVKKKANEMRGKESTFGKKTGEFTQHGFRLPKIMDEQGPSNVYYKKTTYNQSNVYSQVNMYDVKTVYNRSNTFYPAGTYGHNNTFTQSNTLNQKNSFIQNKPLVPKRTSKQGSISNQSNDYNQNNFYTQNRSYAQNNSYSQNNLYTQHSSYIENKMNYNQNNTPTHNKALLPTKDSTLLRNAPQEDYDLTNSKLLLAEDFKCKACKIIPQMSQDSNRDTSVMTAIQLFNIKISPRLVKIGLLAKNSPYTQRIIIKNENTIPIKVLIGSGSPHMVRLKNPRATILAKSETFFDLTLYAPNYNGIFDATVHITVNEAYDYQVVIAGVSIESMLVVDKSELTLDNYEKTVDFLNLYNPYNSTVYFSWIVAHSCIRVKPSDGEVSGKSHILSMVNYVPTNSTRLSELTLVVDGKFCTTIKVNVDHFPLKLRILDKYIRLPAIPLNIPIRKYIRFRNDGTQRIPYRIQHFEPIPGLKISRNEGHFFEKSETFLTLDIQIASCIFFDTQIEIEIPNQPKRYQIDISGSVVAPEILISPDIITFRRLVCHAVDRTFFTVKNNSGFAAYIEFPYLYKEYTITSTPYRKDTVGRVDLKPKERKQLCMHFNPVDVLNSRFYLPILLNGVLSPENWTIKMDPAVQPIESFLSLKGTALSRKACSVPPIEVVTYAYGEAIHISSNKFSFHYFPHPKFSSLTSREFTLKNKSHQTQSFCIRTDTLEEEFSLWPISDLNLEIYDNSITGVLERDSLVNFAINFKPTTPGSYSCQLPLYLRGYMEGAVFNYIDISGIYYNPTITVDNIIVYLEPVPLKTIAKKTVTLTCSYHFKPCYLTAKSTDNLMVAFKTGRTLNTDNLISSCELILSFSSASPKILNTTVTISCLCNATCQIRVKGCTANCTITSHAFIQVDGLYIMQMSYGNLTTKLDQSSCESQSLPETASVFELAVDTNDTSYPFFPNKEDTSSYACHMRQTLEIIEIWLYEQGFFKTIFVKIPEGFAKPTTEDFIKSSIKEKLPYLKLLENVAGKQVLDLVHDLRENLPRDPRDMVYAIYCINVKIISLLTDNGAFLPSVEPEILLSFDQYQIYQEKVNDPVMFIESNQTYSETEFYNLSKQNWLDVVLQTYKVFVLSRIEIEPPRTNFSPTDTTGSQSEHSLNFENADRRYSGILYEPVENKFVYWLQLYFNTYKNRIFNLKFPEKSIRMLERDLCSSVGLIVVTTQFCPFTKDRFKDCYFIPEFDEQIYYNAATLVKVWTDIGCSLTITPEYIMDASMILMVILVTYLYNFLPNLQPNSEIILKAGVSKTATHSIRVINENDFEVKYVVIFYKNEEGCFSCDNTHIILKPKKQTNLHIQYHAKRIKKIVSYLVLNGECAGYHYAKSIAFCLHGEPDITKGYLEFNVNTPMYKIVTRVISIHSPYPVATTYEVSYCISPPTDLDSMVLYNYKETRASKPPLVIQIVDKMAIETDETGFAEVALRCAALVQSRRDFFMILSSAEVGDFTAIVHYRCSKFTKKSHHLEVPISSKVLAANCICKNNFSTSCPKTINIKIPSMNQFIMSMLVEIFLADLNNATDRMIWDKILQKPVGLMILGRIMHDSKLLIYKVVQHVFSGELTTFMTKVNTKDPSFLLPPSVKFSVFPEPGHVVTLPMHLTGDCLPKNCELVLTTENGEDRRFYQLCFQFVEGE